MLLSLDLNEHLINEESVTMTQIDAMKEPNGVLDDFRWESVSPIHFFEFILRIIKVGLKTIRVSFFKK
jgi:hypothetical protein